MCPGVIIWHWASSSTLVQIMAWCLFGTMPLPEPMMTYWQWYFQKTNFSEILSNLPKFSYKKMHLEISSGKCRPFCSGLSDEMSIWTVVTPDQYVWCIMNGIGWEGGTKDGIMCWWNIMYHILRREIISTFKSFTWQLLMILTNIDDF